MPRGIPSPHTLMKRELLSWAENHMGDLLNSIPDGNHNVCTVIVLDKGRFKVWGHVMAYDGNGLYIHWGAYREQPEYVDDFT